MKYIIPSDIFDETIASKITFDDGAFSADRYYHLEVYFHVKWITDPRFQKENALAKKALDKDSIYKTLDEKLGEIELFFSSRGVRFIKTAIIGENLERIDIIRIEITEVAEEETTKKRGKSTPTIKTRCIVPSRPYMLETWAKILAPIIFKELEEERRKSESS